MILEVWSPRCVAQGDNGLKPDFILPVQDGCLYSDHVHSHTGLDDATSSTVESVDGFPCFCSSDVCNHPKRKQLTLVHDS